MVENSWIESAAASGDDAADTNEFMFPRHPALTKPPGPHFVGAPRQPV